jgi:hypothetical protein
MKAMGVPDVQMEASWGKDVFAANKAQEKSSHAQRWLNEMNEKFQAKIKPEEIEEELAEEPTDFGNKDVSTISDEE